MSLSVLSIVFPNGDPPQEAYEAMMVDYVAHCEHYDEHRQHCWRDNCAECIEREGRTHEIFWRHAGSYSTTALLEENHENDDLHNWVCDQIAEMLNEAKSVSSA
jgi:muconolactone delta-isomerase